MTPLTRRRFIQAAVALPVVSSLPMTAAHWTMETARDLPALHGMDVELELARIFHEEFTKEYLASPDGRATVQAWVDELSPLPPDLDRQELTRRVEDSYRFFPPDLGPSDDTRHLR